MTHKVGYGTYTLVAEVYSILSIQFILTFVIAIGCCVFSDVRVTLAENAQTYHVVFFLLGLPAFLCFVFGEQMRKTYPTNMYLFGAFSIAMGLQLGTLCAFLYEHGLAQAILLALFVTILVFLSLSAYALCSGIDFSFLHAGLVSMLSLLLLWSLVALFLPNMVGDGLVYAIISTIVFSLFVLCDTARMIYGDKHKSDAMLIAMDLYLDFVNLFLEILRIIIILQGKDKDDKDKSKKKN